MLEQLQDSARAVLIFQSECTSREFIEYILHDLGVDVTGMGLVAMHGKLNEILFEELMKGKRFVLVVDEAQNLADSVLETVRMLSNFETHNAKLLQIVLAGQPALAAKLAQPNMSQLRQRVSVLSTLQPFTPEDTRLYIEHRLRVAGFTGETLFEPASIRLIARQSKGIPRNINNLCYNSMVLSYSRRRRVITPEIVQEVIEGLDLEALFPQSAALAASAAGEPSAAAAVSVAPSAASPSPAVSIAPASGAPVSGPSVSANPASGASGNGTSASTAFAPGTSAHDAPKAVASKSVAAASSGPVVSSSKPIAAATAKTPSPRVAAAPSTPARKDPPSKTSLTYTGDATNRFLKWSGRSAAVAAALLGGSLFLTILLGRAESRQVLTRGMFDHTSSELGDALPVATTNAAPSLYDATPQDTGNGQVLTVAAGAQQSLKDLSMRYVGRFDGNLEKQIISLNPGLHEPNHLEAGQLIRIPLPPGALRPVNDTAADSSDATPGKSGSLFARLTAMLRDRK
jgi:type II secretory pathway predicted ATPase ExeA